MNFVTPLQAQLAYAIHLRESGNHEGACQLLLELHSEFTDDPQVNYQCAWIHELLGLEREAIPFYEKAIRVGLDGNDQAAYCLVWAAPIAVWANIKSPLIHFSAP